MKYKNIKVSIVTVCYNSEVTIEQTIRSVLSQSYKNIEYIIIDGASTDQTLDIIKEYKNDLAYLVSEPDKGIYDAMNKGIKKATGDIIGFINSDDWYSENAVLSIVEAFLSSKADVVYGNTMIVENGTHKMVLCADLDNICYRMVFGHQAAFVKTHILRENLFDCAYKIVADHAFFLSLYFQKKSFFYKNALIAYFRIGGASSCAWKTYMDDKKAVFRISKKYVDKARYEQIKNVFKKRRIYPIFLFLSQKLKKNQKSYNLENNKKLILYGAGKFGQIAYATMKNLRSDVVAFWDGDCKKWGKTIDGKLITEPIKKQNQSSDAYVLITVVDENEKIEERLKSLGYKCKTDYFLPCEWVKYMAGFWLNHVIG